MEDLKVTDTSNRFENEKLITTILSEYYPELSIGPGTPFYEMVIRPMAFAWSKHSEGIKELNLSNSFAVPELMASEDMDRLMTRTFDTRKVGTKVYGVVRHVFNTQKNYTITAGTVFTASGGRVYTATQDTYILGSQLSGNQSSGWTLDIQVESQGTGNMYNGKANETVTPPAELRNYVMKCYFPVDTSDGGISETNAAFYSRVKGNVTLKNLTTYRGLRATLLDNFNLRDVVLVGIRDPEMRRDLFELPSETGVYTVHRGSMNDTYVRNEPYAIVSGFQAPLGFPYMYNGVSMATDPDGLLAIWNAIGFKGIETSLRGSVYETLPISTTTRMSTLTSSIKEIQSFVGDIDHEALHSENLIKQMWPLVTRIKVRVSGVTTSSAAIQTAIMAYIASLGSGDYPQIGNVIDAAKSGGCAYVHVPIELEAFYLKENLVMEKIGINKKVYPEDALLVPLQEDSLMFKCRNKSHISIRTCFWYTNADLVKVEVV